MTERLLQFIWQFQYFNPGELETVEHEPVQIIYQGQYNSDQGPDFSNAKLRIDGTLWAGTVELHNKTSDWRRHKHQHDRKYENVILHVVWEHDTNVNSIPVLELKGRVPGLLLQRYSELMNSMTFIACEKKIHTVKEITWLSWKDRMIAERFARKGRIIQKYLTENNGHWEETFWWLLTRNFGMHVNTESFEAIARSLPLSLLAKHKNQIHQLEALLLGQAGLLQQNFKEAYPLLLQKEYKFLKRKYHLHPVHSPILFLRMRPGNFPTIRLAQLAMLIHTVAHLFSVVKEAGNVKEVRDCFDITANDYWHYHYRFDRLSAFKKKKLGASMIDNIIINTVCPVLFAYGTYHNEPIYTEKALQWLSGTAPEISTVTRGFQQAGITVTNAADSQALLELKTCYCDERRCLDCGVGNAVLRGAK